MNEQSLYSQRYNVMNSINIYNPLVGIIVASATHAGCVANLERTKEIIPPMIKLKSAKVPLHFAEQMTKKFPQEEKSEEKPNVDNNKSTAQSQRREERADSESGKITREHENATKDSQVRDRKHNHSSKKDCGFSIQGNNFESTLDRILGKYIEATPPHCINGNMNIQNFKSQNLIRSF